MIPSNFNSPVHKPGLTIRCIAQTVIVKVQDLQRLKGSIVNAAFGTLGRCALPLVVLHRQTQYDAANPSFSQ